MDPFKFFSTVFSSIFLSNQIDLPQLNSIILDEVSCYEAGSLVFSSTSSSFSSSIIIPLDLPKLQELSFGKYAAYYAKQIIFCKLNDYANVFVTHPFFKDNSTTNQCNHYLDNNDPERAILPLHASSTNDANDANDVNANVNANANANANANEMQGLTQLGIFMVYKDIQTILLQNKDFDINQFIGDHLMSRHVRRYPLKEDDTLQNQKNIMKTPPLSYNYIQALDFTQLDLQNKEILMSVEHILIGNTSFKAIKEFHLTGFESLRTLTIDEFCFYDDMPVKKLMNGEGSFSITNCRRLASVLIGIWSFAKYTSFTLESS